MNRIWRLKRREPELSSSLAASLNVSPIIAQLLFNRGIKDEMQAHHFLHGDLTSCHDPALFKDMEKAATRINRAIKSKENILLYGDYDVDGITSVALLNIVLTRLGAKVTNYIPNRLEEGYGLNINAVKLAHRNKNSLMITVDCGISAHKEIDLANEFGIDVIITDHHEIKSETLPKAYAIINPLQKDCNYPFKHLAGVGLAYKLAQVLLKNTPYQVEEHLDLVALGTVSDMSVQKGENRILTKEGLKKLSTTEKMGIKALVEVAGLKGKIISCSHIGYILGPRINAMGRVGSPEVSLNLLLTSDPNEAQTKAGTLNRENRNRQKIEARVTSEAMEKIEREINFKDSRIIVLSGSSWHTGVIGIVASRVIDKFYRPTIIISVDGKIGKGSGRSINNFHLFNAINSCKKHLVDFGGHEGACGLVIEKKNIIAFTESINKIAKDVIADKDLYPALDIDIEVELSEISEKLIEELALMVPFGPENPKPMFSSSNVYLRNEPRRIAKNGFKMLVTDNKTTCEAISFRAEGMSVPYKGSKVSLVYSPSINTWQGLSSLQLDLKDLKVAE
ncbi:MAG: single-stranded-DNA-specific exonuclease RecJ [Candidatus Omnitrophica bacterium]|nr:single-stranded-DNA-specific exonuclease RecJ [Candidatus Omnitrophota bacterium]